MAAQTLAGRFNALTRMPVMTVNSAEPIDGSNIFTFGKYRGHSFQHVYDSHPDYVMWCCQHMIDTTGRCQKDWMAYIQDSIMYYLLCVLNSLCK